MNTLRRLSSMATNTFQQLFGMRGIRSIMPAIHTVLARARRMHTLRDDEDFYRYTRGRFVRGEQAELAQRQVKFDLNALGLTAARAVESTSCIGIQKCLEGHYNKAFLLTMDDGKQVVAKIPNPNAGKAFYTTASEVATMRFVRDILGHPVPRVLAWSSAAQDSPIGAEYIIMEKAPGVSLSSVWADMDIRERWAVTQAAMNYQRDWASTAFPSYGSLYFSSDLTAEPQEMSYILKGEPASTSLYAVGPITGSEWKDYERMNVECDRGPYELGSSSREYFRAVGSREMAAVRQLPSLHKSTLTLCGPNTYIPTRQRKEKAIQCYMDLVDIATPTDEVLCRPSLWHGDLHIENVFVDPEDKSKIISIIDWQSTDIAPLFEQAREPAFLDFDGQQLTGLERPVWPDESKLSSEERVKAENVYISQSLVRVYRIGVQSQMPDVWKSFEYWDSPRFQIFLLARRLSVEGEALYLCMIVYLADSDREIYQALEAANGEHRAEPIRLSLSGPGRAKLEDDAERAAHGMEEMQRIHRTMKHLISKQGFVWPKDYDEAKEALRQIKAAILQQYARTDEERRTWIEHWPFDS